MNRFISIIFVAACAGAAFGQGSDPQRAKVQYVEVPRDQALIVVVHQPTAPLRIEAAGYLLQTARGTTIIRYKVRNISSKPITGFTVVAWDLGGTGGTLPLSLRDGELLRPGETWDSIGENAVIDTFTEKVRGKLKQNEIELFEGKLRQIHFLLVDQVFFANGETFKDQKVSDALSDFLSSQRGSSEP